MTANDVAGTGFAPCCPAQHAGRDLVSASLFIRHCAFGTDLAVLTAVGEVDLATAPLLRTALSRCERDGTVRVIVDLSEVSFLAAAGAEVLRATATLAGDEGRKVAVVTTAQVDHVLELTGLTEVIPAATSFADAVAELGLG
ncbi:STAS domain-containing protein [Saccharomonospora sp. NPDC006951]